MNALLGEAVLPSAVVLLTSIPTFLHGGDELAARVLFDNGGTEERFTQRDTGALANFLARFVTESANPHNRLGVRLVEAAYPAPVLRQGLALIDTPGIGSTFRHNTEPTVNFLLQCDAALFVVSADPPITEVEVEFLKLARRKLARVFFILNKVDYLTGEERQSAIAFLQQVLCEQVGFSEPPPIFCASARELLAARQNRDVAAWQRSGLAQIEHAYSASLGALLKAQPTNCSQPPGSTTPYPRHKRRLTAMRLRANTLCFVGRWGNDPNRHLPHHGEMDR